MHWPYTKRPDGRIAITLDNNVWDFLFDRGIDLASELPSEDFAVFITREVEIEGSAIPDDPSKTALKGYIAQAISSCDIQTISVFGFASPGPGPLLFAAEHGGKILYLENFDTSGLTLRAFVEAFYQQI
jgi:hypothetical protein